MPMNRRPISSSSRSRDPSSSWTHWRAKACSPPRANQASFDSAPTSMSGRGDRGRRRSSGQDHRQHHRTLKSVEVVIVPGTNLAGPLALLEESLRDGEPVPEDFAERLRRAVEAGDIEMLAAQAEDGMLGVVVLAY